MKFNPESDVPGPEVVFDPTYWGEFEDEPDDPNKKLYHGMASIKSSRAGELLLQETLGDIIDGEPGHILAKGVTLNPADRDLSLTSTVNFPGSIWLMDVEVISVYNKKDRIDHKDVAPIDDETPAHLHLSPRELLRQRAKTDDYGVTHYYQGKAEYHNGEMAYSRMARVGVIGQSRRGVGSFMPLWEARRQPDGTFSYVTTFSKDPHLPAITGATHGRNDDKGNLQYARRVRSLEVCANGAPAVAPERKPLFSFLSRLAPN